MGCLSKITVAITNTCSIVPSSGLGVKGWIFNRADITWTVGASLTLITSGANASTKKAWTITAVKKENNAGADAVIADNLPGMFKHVVSIQPYERDEDAIKNIDEMDDIVVVVELKGPKTQGCFVILGYETGLHKQSASWKALDNHNIPTYEFATRDGEEEKYSRYVFWVAADTYALTLAALVALETPGA